MAGKDKLTKEARATAKAYVDDFREYGHAVPSHAGLSRVLKVSRRLLYYWAERDTEFAGIMEDIKTEQELVTINESLTNNYNSAIAKLLLGKHGYHDTKVVEADVTSRTVEPLTDKEAKAINKAIEDEY